jgi:hypothetical protein
MPNWIYNFKRIQRQNNHVHNSSGYVDINMPNVHNSDGIKARFCEGQNQGHGLFEIPLAFSNRKSSPRPQRINPFNRQ